MDETNKFMDETNLWIRMKQGDVKALSALYELYADLLCDFGNSLSGNQNFVLDCIHDLFLDLYKYRKKLSPEVNIKFYLLKSLKRKIFQKAKGKSKVHSLSAWENKTQLPDVEPSIEEAIINSEDELVLNCQLMRAIQSLTYKQREAIKMRFTENSSYEEIAMNMGISVQSARTIIYRSIKRLKQHFSF